MFFINVAIDEILTKLKVKYHTFHVILLLGECSYAFGEASVFITE